MKPRPFISYAHEDRAAALKLYTDLRARGANPWLDEKELLGGQEWEVAIRKAVHECTHFLALLSSHSVNKRGFVQKEVRQAIDILDEFPPGEIFIIPVRLDDANPSHEALKKLHWIDLFPSYQQGLRKLAKSLGIAEEAPSEAWKDLPWWQVMPWSTVLIVIIMAGAPSIFRWLTAPEPKPPAAVTTSVTTTAEPGPLHGFPWGEVKPASSNAAVPSGPRVALILGHADRPSENRSSTYAISEEEYLVRFAPELAQELIKRGVPVSIQPQTAQVLTDLQERANEVPIVIAFHLNGARDAQVSGSEAIIAGDASASTRAFAERLQDGVISTLGTRNRGVKTNQQFMILRRLRHGVHLELFFLSNDRDTEAGLAKRSALAARLADVIAAEISKRT